MTTKPSTHTRDPYPFSAIVGQDTVKLALLLNAVSPSTGGVLIQGEKGNAKSTAVRALAKLLPPIAVVPGCPLSCDPEEPFSFCPHCRGVPYTGEPAEAQAPFIEIPLGTSEDRLLGHMDLDAALNRGDRFFEAGLLARAHRGVLYVDEINLLPDHLVDILLDAAASGWNHVERDGFSVSHPARFILVGTMNPEEGELRPQLLDRFGLSVEVTTPQDVPSRTEIMKRRLAYEQSPAQFAGQWAGEEDQLRAHLRQARRAFGDMELPAARLEQVARICLQAQTEGMRADLVICEAAKSLAAFRGHPAVTAQDVREAAPLALFHRSAHPWHPDPEPDGSGSDGSGDGSAADQGAADGAAGEPSAHGQRPADPAGHAGGSQAPGG
ncbi:ATP-binding protein, partial [Paenibacillus senegalensis]|uniref:ATP-binding protein n=1 Tax=Paenibacillus senegalensis TaxID=1465766 RepID=UPI000288EFE1